MNLYKKLYARFFERRMRGYEVLVGKYKKRLITRLNGVVVEMGSGTGPNLVYLKKDVTYIGIEPSVFMHEEFIENAKKLDFQNYKLITADAEHTTLPDNSTDFVIGTLFLCSVDDSVSIIKEIIRILKPGGKYIFVEHVIAPKNTWFYFLQKSLKTIHKIRADGCNLDRDTGNIIKKQNFSKVEFENFSIPFGLVSPHIAGYAIK